MSDILLDVRDLQVWFDTPEGVVRAVDGVSYTVARGETLALLGESGCGKSISALALLQLVPRPAGRVAGGQVLLDGRDLLRVSERDMRAVRGRRIGMIFQEPQSALNPVLTIGQQIAEALPATLTADRRRARVIEWLEAVGIADPARRHDEYPHQLSGGMKQRAMIAMALAAEPELLIADEPTTALDVTTQAQILALLKDLQRRTGMAMLFITHDLGVAAQVADRVAVMYAGELVELAARDPFFAGARHPYARKLLRAVPGRAKRGGRLETISGSVPPLSRVFTGCRFADRCPQAWATCSRQLPRWLESEGGGVRCHLYDADMAGPPAGVTGAVAAAPAADMPPGADDTALLRVTDLKVHFPIQRGLLRRVVGQVKAVDGVSLQIPAGRTLALVGESGCGKTTVGRGILQLIRPTAGAVDYDGAELTALSPRALRPLRRQLQVVFQDPYASLDPRMRVAEIIEEGLLALGLATDPGVRRQRVAELLEQVGLPAAAANRYPHEFSGGQRQRLCIARALAVGPRLIVCDEPTSALDVSVQAQILNLLKRLQDELGLSYLFISHNLAVVEYLAHQVAVMYLGRIVEQGSAHEVLESPRHPYTQALLAAAPVVPEPGLGQTQRSVLRLAGEMPSPVHPPSGCHFHPRCPQAMPQCRAAYPDSSSLSATHSVRCFLYSSSR